MSMSTSSSDIISDYVLGKISVSVFCDRLKKNYDTYMKNLEKAVQETLIHHQNLRREKSQFLYAPRYSFL